MYLLECKATGIYLLTNLNDGLPEVFGLHTVAVVTHLGLDDKLDHKYLL